MDVVKSILNSEIERINRAEGRDGKARLNVEFFTDHPWLCLAMFIGYIAVGIVMYASPYMGLGWFSGFSAFCCLWPPCCCWKSDLPIAMKILACWIFGSVITVNGSLAVRSLPPR